MIGLDLSALESTLIIAPANTGTRSPAYLAQLKPHFIYQEVSVFSKSSISGLFNLHHEVTCPAGHELTVGAEG